MSNYDDLADYADEAGALEMGIRNPFRRRRKPSRNAMIKRRLTQGTAGAPQRGPRLQPLGMGASAFTAASGTVLALTALPQRFFKGQRFVLDITRTGASATGLVTVTRFDVGSDNQNVSSGALASSAFSSVAVDVNLDLDPARPGIVITAQLAISAAPAGADRVDFAGVLFGTSWA